MTIGCWIGFIFFSICIIGGAIAIAQMSNSVIGKILIILVAIILVFGMFAGLRWYFTSTASGQRALTDQKSEYAGGLDRTITIYTADGEIIAQYEGRIDIDTNDGGYVKFDFEGKRYIYYNCFVESIADIG
jgi:hypothetical protein